MLTDGVELLIVGFKIFSEYSQIYSLELNNCARFYYIWQQRLSSQNFIFSSILLFSVSVLHWGETLRYEVWNFYLYSSVFLFVILCPRLFHLVQYLIPSSFQPSAIYLQEWNNWSSNPSHSGVLSAGPSWKMKQILVSQSVKVPDGVTVKVNARRVTVVGPRGKLQRDFKHLALDMQVIGWFDWCMNLALTHTCSFRWHPKMN